MSDAAQFTTANPEPTNPMNVPGTRPQGARLEPTALVALLLSLLSFVIWVLPAIVALAMGHAAKKNIEASQGYRYGKGLAIAAAILSIISIAITVLILAVLLFN